MHATPATPAPVQSAALGDCLHLWHPTHITSARQGHPKHSCRCRSQRHVRGLASSAAAAAHSDEVPILRGPSRRACVLSAATVLLIQGCQPPAARAETYSSEQQHYRLDPPPGWQQTSKQGADVLFQDPEEKGTNLGVTVTPLKISSLDQFGAIEKAGQRILGVERAKESTKSIDMMRQEVRSANGTKFYDFDYVIDTTRGTKRVLSYVTIVNKKLYIVNGTIKCSKGSCAGVDNVAQLLDSAMKSFVVT